jgi:hypothetical protein
VNRVWTLNFFLIRDLFRSLLGVVPVAIAVAFGLLAFEYGMDQAQFFTVAGLGTGLICLVTALLLANRANRATSYLLLARLRRRTELLAASVFGGLLITMVLAMALTLANLLAGRLALELQSLPWLLITWLPLWILCACLALPLSALVGRRGSHLVGQLLVVALLVVHDKSAPPAIRSLRWLVRVADSILWPLGTLLSRASGGTHDRTFFLTLALTLIYAALLFLLADQLLADKDLVWTE